MQELLTFPTEELYQENQVYLTICQETHSTPINSDRDRIQFDNLLKEAEEKVCNKYDEKLCEQLLAQIKDLRDQPDFWGVGDGSYVIYATPEEVYYYRLDIPVKDEVMVGDKPNVLPLIENFQYVTYYHLLALTKEKFKLFNGRRYSLEEIDLSQDEDAPTDLNKALGDELTGGELNSAGYGAGGGHVYHGHNETNAEKEIDMENYFRVVDKYVWEHYSKPTELPLVVFALPENQAEFRKLSKNKYLDEVTIEHSPAQASNKEIQEKTAETIREIVDKRHRDLIARFEETAPKFKLDAQYEDLAFSSVQGKIDYLLVEKGYEVPGSIDENGQYTEGPVDGYVNQLAWNVLRANGKVYVLETEDMPSSVHIAAVLRY
ncbi:hypothetical protein [Atopococcus tabaci]|uniref:baeRF6 domain-containing protein n=1 Tax=Atopococcus tabaci TaxID=269774 RepID=UPI00040933DE|nr:hypothetical protein [Atopococcus tabaci]